MRRRLSCKLNDPFSQVGFAHLDTGSLEMLIEMNLFRGHGLRFHDALDAVHPGEIQNVLAHLGGIVGTKYLGPAGFGVLREALCKFVEMRSRIGFSFGNLGSQRLKVIALISFLAADPVGLGKSSQCPGKVGIVQRLIDRLTKFCFH